METALFWLAWGIVSFWVLKTFYFSYHQDKLQKLRKTALGINLSVLVLSFLPWLPPELGSKSGFTLAMGGNLLAVLFIFLIIVAVVLFLTKTPSNHKMAAVATIFNTFALFILMYQLRPGTFILTAYDIAPIIAFLFFLIGDLVVLLLWQQLQLKTRKK